MMFTEEILAVVLAGLTGLVYGWLTKKCVRMAEMGL